MSKLVNIAGQHSPTTGTGTLTLSDSVPGHVTFEIAGLTNGDHIGYVIWDNFGSYGPESREVGRGTYDNNTLSRDTVLTSTETGHARIDCTGSAQVYVTALAEDLSSAAVSDIAPSNPDNGQLWWETGTGNLYVYYRDVDSSQWVPTVNLTGTEWFPDQSGKAGQYLKTHNGVLEWAPIELYPSITGNAEKFLKVSNGVAVWSDLYD